MVDTNGDGKRGEYTEPNQPLDPSKDRRLNVATYGIGVAPDGVGVDLDPRVPGLHRAHGSGRGSAEHRADGNLRSAVRRPKKAGYGPRGMDVDRNGVVWVPLSSGHMASFDRRKCKVLNGPTAASGRHCPEGWTLYQFPGPAVQGLQRAGQRRVRAITPGSTSSTRSASAPTCRWRPATPTSRSSRSSTASG